jgi:hypothetical protein
LQRPDRARRAVADLVGGHVQLMFATDLHTVVIKNEILER